MIWREHFLDTWRNYFVGYFCNYKTWFKLELVSRNDNRMLNDEIGSDNV